MRSTERLLKKLYRYSLNSPDRHAEKRHDKKNELDQSTARRPTTVSSKSRGIVNRKPNAWVSNFSTVPVSKLIKMSRPSVFIRQFAPMPFRNAGAKAISGSNQTRSVAIKSVGAVAHLCFSATSQVAQSAWYLCKYSFLLSKIFSTSIFFG